MIIYIRKTMKCKNNKITHDVQYKGILLLKEHLISGFYKYKLDLILKYFNYIDSIDYMCPKFIRFHFDKTWNKHDVQEFFKQTKKWHSDNNRFFAYLCSMEEDEYGNNHYHAFCILNANDYKTRTKAINMLHQRSDFLLKKKPTLEKIHVNTNREKHNNYYNIRIYNYYSISNNINKNERKQALSEASYLAKVEKSPLYSKKKRERSIFGSELPYIDIDKNRNKLDENLKNITSTSLCSSQFNPAYANISQNINECVKLNL